MILERKAGGLIGGDDAIGLGIEYARENSGAAGLGYAADAGGELGQRTGQNIGDHQIIGRARGDLVVIEPGGLDGVDLLADAIFDRIVDGGGHGDGVDVGGENDRLEPLGQGNGEDASAGADIDHAHRGALGQQGLNGLKAPGGGLVVAGAEGLGGVDFHRRQAFGHGRCFVAAIDIEAAGNDRRQAFQRFGDPVDLRINRGDGEGDIAAQNLAGQLGKGGNVRRAVAGGFEHPLAGFFVFVRRGGQGQVVALGDGIDQGIGLLLGQGDGKLVDGHGKSLALIGWLSLLQGWGRSQGRGLTHRLVLFIICSELRDATCMD